MRHLVVARSPHITGHITVLASISLAAFPLAAVGGAGQGLVGACPSATHPIFRVTVTPELGFGSLAGRLIIMMSNQLGPGEELSPHPGSHSVWIVAKEVRNLVSQTPIDFDSSDMAFPDAFCKATQGNYRVRAVLDVSHHFAYRSRPADGDLVSAVVEQPFQPTASSVIRLTLVERKTDAPLQLPPRTETFDIVSPSLSAFWGQPTHMRGAVLLPPGYAAGRQRYPAVYVNHGFSQDLGTLLQRYATNVNQLMEERKIPEMIWVMLVEAVPTGTHEFADSVNNGPWGGALTTELIPYLEKRYRMDAKASGRLLTGHSSGGWASLWIQISHPAFFGGSWPTAPDPVDFRSFAGIDLTRRPTVNYYYLDDGSPRMFVRRGDKDTQSLEDLVREERVLGEYGGQSASFDWVFSPRGKDGRPMPLFDRETGAIDPTVADYWEQHYDIATLLRNNWPKIGPLLNGKIHLTVGTADTFHLDEPARLLEQTIKEVGGKAQFNYIPGGSHFDLYQDGLLEQIANEMYTVARPHSAANKQPVD